MTRCCAASSRTRRDTDVKNILKMLRSGQSFLVLSHQNPEGDAIGSTLALSFALREMGKSVTMFNQDGMPDTFLFLPGAEEVGTSIPAEARFDAICMVDCGDPELLGSTFSHWRRTREALPSIIVIDHHRTNKNFGNLNHVEPEASSAGEVIYRIIKKLPVEISPQIAAQIYTAIMCDTGSFRYSNTSARTFAAAGELVARGADPWSISQHVYENQPVRRLRLLACVLNTLEMSMHGKAASLTVLLDMYSKTGAKKEDTEEFVNYTRAIEGVEVGMLFREIEGGKFRVSLRSRGTADVSQIAQEFGGGGHANAAGCTVEGTLEEAKRKVLDTLTRRVALL